MTPIDLKECTFFLLDGTTPTPNFIAIRIGEGNFTYTVKRNIDQRKSRGTIYQTRESEEEPMDIAFQFVWDQIVGSSPEPATVEDVLYHTGLASSWVSASFSDINSPHTVNIQIVRSLTCRLPNGATQNNGSIYNFPEFNFTELNHSIKDATIDCKGICNRAKPIISRP